jgi:hypothetical protein
MTTQALRGSLRVPRDSRPVARAVSAGVVASVLLSALVSGCGSEPSGAGGATTPSPSSEATSATQSPLPDKVVATMHDKIEAAVADLAATLGIPTSGVTVVSTDAVTWRDGSIGCPKKGMAYTQALVDGYLIILEVDGTRYRYHSSVTGAPFQCTENAQDPLPRGGSGAS